MDFQTLINLAAGIAVAVSSWFASELWSAVKDLRKDLSMLREEIAKQYTSKDESRESMRELKDDFREAIREVKDLLVGIDTKLDRKADK